MKIIPEMSIESWLTSIGLLTCIVLIIKMIMFTPNLVIAIIGLLKKPEKQKYQIIRTNGGLRWKPIKVLSMSAMVVEKIGDEFYDKGEHVKIIDGNILKYVPCNEISEEKPDTVPDYEEGCEK